MKMYYRKALFLLLLAVVCVLLPFAAFAQQGVVTLPTEDKWQLSSLFQPSQNGFYVIILHDLGGKKEDFTSFSRALKEQGYGTLAIDMRGHGQSTNIDIQKNFKKTGTDNDFNKMVRDVTASVNFLNKKGVENKNIYIIGAGLGANVAAKSLIFNPDIAGVILLTPSLKMRDVLTMSGIKVFKNPVLIAVSSEDKKLFMEASFIRNAALLSSGEGKVTFLTAYSLSGVDMLDKYLTPEVLQWLQTPQKPEVQTDYVEVETIPSPSVLEESAAKESL
jgi:dienelactone hydrolase